MPLKQPVLLCVPAERTSLVAGYDLDFRQPSLGEALDHEVNEAAHLGGKVPSRRIDGVDGAVRSVVLRRFLGLLVSGCSLRVLRLSGDRPGQRHSCC